MATTEGKAEAVVAKVDQAKPEPKEVEEPQEPPLKCETTVLKVSIHCEGCKRKVKKILTNTDGVFKTDIDLRQQKVIVLGEVDAGTLIKKLVKAGRHAELWPEKADQKEKKQGKGKKKDKQSNNQESNNDQETSQNHAGDKEKETVKIEEPIHPASAAKISESCSNSKNNCILVDGKGAVQFKIKESKPEPAGSQSPVPEKKGGGECDGGGAAEKVNGGSGGKKKKKKGHKGNGNGTGNGNADEGEHSGDVPASTGSPIHHLQGPTHVPIGPSGPGPVPSPATYNLPRQHGYEYRSHYYSQPMYAMGYNAEHPSSSYTASYYASPPPYSYTYMHPGGPIEPSLSDPDVYSSQPTDSFELFSDENPNACSIM